MWLTLMVAATGVFPGLTPVARASIAAKPSKASTKTSSKSGGSSIATPATEELTAAAALRQAEQIHASIIGEANVARLAHAKELLGKYYKRSIVSKEEHFDELNEFVRERLKIAFAKVSKGGRVAQQVYKTILAESKKHSFDPIFLMAVIENESSFNLKARGTSGEIGLMQLMPDTGKWIAKKIGVKWNGEKTLEDPVQNIRIGAAYMALLREKFDSHSRLYLAAYNMGQKNVSRALAKEIWPKDYPIRVMQRYIRFYTELAGTKAGDAEEAIN